MSATGAQQALIGRPRLVRRPYREPRIKRADLRAQFIALTVPRAFDGVCTPIRQAVAPQAACQAAVIRGKRDSVPVVPRTAAREEPNVRFSGDARTAGRADRQS